jgi:hypothetical protein
MKKKKDGVHITTAVAFGENLNSETPNITMFAI